MSICLALHPNAIQYPVITASEPLRERYRSWASSSGTSTPALSSNTPRSPDFFESSSSQSRGKQRSVEQPPAVAIKKKKKTKKVVKHPEPDPSKLGLGRGPPTADSETQGLDGAGPTGLGEAVQRQQNAGSQEPQEHTSDYNVPESEEFRNVWGGDK